MYIHPSHVFHHAQVSQTSRLLPNQNIKKNYIKKISFDIYSILINFLSRVSILLYGRSSWHPSTLGAKINSTLLGGAQRIIGE